MDRNGYFFIGSVLNFSINLKANYRVWTNFLFVYMLMRDASLKQRPCIIRISIFRALSAEKKCVLYTGKYGNMQLIILSHGQMI